ncbi:MAG TPA: hypothetical protein VFS90_23115 [Pyrinomonadaceae bacterium]|nr:hypothetical protein [Pyrinomonadaceae bacterium]
MIAAWIEIIVGVSFILATNVQSQFIFAATPDGVASVFARFAGIALIGLGIACLPSQLAGTNRNAVLGLFVFNVAVTIFFAWVAMATTFRGMVLWPVVILHAVISLALAPSLKRDDS